MGIIGILTLVTTFITTTYPIAVAIGLLGHALAASSNTKVKRVGITLEGIGVDWKRIASAFSKDLK